ncbi:hypothetical protein SEUBUCD646_0K01120 [Saccharomyces eubayanus]|uniref:KTI12-like protein n=1 Tax=Saccharomyces eubayanus TaxID=1080349 RepID=A0ABN8VI65_SACEU|nr:hypothetical protein SEUBUCD650_0K01140 [Saccharomyces eubayanus]CAI1560655.1 hypothetical protein SEUBUCD646_0K01120 [Saccharomyces eubayanus]
MPLVLFTGYPCSGKTTLAKHLVQLLQSKIDATPSLSKYSIVYHSDETLGIKHSDYITSQDERKLRSEIISAVKRDLSRNKIVIVDSLNYIKGFRYQLHCEVKNLSTTFCVIQTLCPPETIFEWNNTSNVNPWEPELLNQLIQRYEEPNSNNRWDSPLFAILTPQDNITECIVDLYKVVFQTSKSAKNSGHNDPLNKGLQKPNSATVLKPASQSNFIQVLDVETTKIIKVIMNHIKSLTSIGGVSNGTRVIVSEGVTDINDYGCFFVDLPIGNVVTLAQLQRLKRQFINFNRLRDIDQDRIGVLFADYLNKNLN